MISRLNIFTQGSKNRKQVGTISKDFLIGRGDSMISEFRMGPAASGRGLCDIDRVQFRGTLSRVKKLEVLTGLKKYRY